MRTGLVKDFKPEATVEVPNVGRLYVGSDLRLYRHSNGPLSLISTCEPVKDSEAGVWLDKVDWAEFPPLSELADLLKRFFSQYDREVVVLIYRKWDESGWFFLVPKQQGGPCAVQWEDKEGAEWGLKFGRYVGTVHVHPGTSAEPSQTDLEWWKEREASGLHAVVGRMGAYTISGSAAGHSFVLVRGDLSGIQPTRATLASAFNRPLRKLLKRMPPPPPPPPRYTQWYLPLGDSAYGSSEGIYLQDVRDVEDLNLVFMEDGTVSVMTDRDYVKLLVSAGDDGLRSMTIRQYFKYVKGETDGSDNSQG